MKKILKYLIESISYGLNSISSIFGVYIIPKWRSHDFMLIKRMQRIIDEYKIDCIIDVGANSGQYYNFLRKDIKYKGLVISFEPDPDNYEIINKRSQRDSLWIVEKYALGNKEAELEFNIMEGSDFNSFLEPDNSETSVFDKSNSIKKVITVPVKRLDALFQNYKKKYNFDNVFLKLDTQGFDLEVFEGALNVLEDIRGVQTEVSFMPLYKNAPTFEKSLKLFRDNGFEVSGLYSLGESRFPHAIEHDCIYLPHVKD